MSKKMDPRVIRTRQLLRDALVALIDEQGYEKITVQDITQQNDMPYTPKFMATQLMRITIKGPYIDNPFER
ncbi:MULTISPECIES: TetR/AcrR family transcriptional regulator [Lysinibacillus]|uniref:TetR/AcrR family transcriptional regulator n=1 Tax=Lysinibacillus TaxID=400634 RepID=UPI00214BADC2|nr:MULTISPECIES: hypothetical protein [Lysinibacillus]UUV26548.1 hypothetical protein NP781_08135 [Lysinibacillus sp. FN11]UYB49429.1 hypothetical protein OCI51_10850 [Lysinibacillus capsici]